MNHKTALAENPVPSPIDVQDERSRGMDQAMGIENGQASWFSVGKLFRAAAQALGFCAEMRRSWFSLVAPPASPRVSTAAHSSCAPSQPSPDELAHSMDIAIGAPPVAAPMLAATTRSIRIAQPQPTPDELAYSMDLALGERFTVSSSTVHSSSKPQAPAPQAEANKELAMAAKAGN